METCLNDAFISVMIPQGVSAEAIESGGGVLQLAAQGLAAGGTIYGIFDKDDNNKPVNVALFHDRKAAPVQRNMALGRLPETDEESQAIAKFVQDQFSRTGAVKVVHSVPSHEATKPFAIPGFFLAGHSWAEYWMDGHLLPMINLECINPIHLAPEANSEAIEKQEEPVGETLDLGGEAPPEESLEDDG